MPSIDLIHGAFVESAAVVTRTRADALACTAGCR